MDSRTDSDVMLSIQRGESTQLAVLFERYHIPLFRYLLHLTGSHSRSEDLVQEVFFRILKYAGSYDTAQSFRVWLYRSARNAHLDSIHKRRLEVQVEDASEVRSAEPMPEERLSRKQDLRHLGEALARLPEAKREVLILSRFHELRYEEIGRILQLDTGAVKVRVYRALRELREMFCELRGEKSA